MTMSKQPKLHTVYLAYAVYFVIHNYLFALFFLNLNRFTLTLDLTSVKLNSNFINIAIINRRCESHEFHDLFYTNIDILHMYKVMILYRCRWGWRWVISGHLRRAVPAVRPDVFFREPGRTGDDRRFAVVLRTPVALRALAQGVGAHFVHVRPLLHGEQAAGLLALTTHLLQKKRWVKLMLVAWLNRHCSIK